MAAQEGLSPRPCSAPGLYVLQSFPLLTEKLNGLVINRMGSALQTASIHLTVCGLLPSLYAVVIWESFHKNSSSTDPHLSILDWGLGVGITIVLVYWGNIC